MLRKIHSLHLLLQLPSRGAMGRWLPRRLPAKPWGGGMGWWRRGWRLFIITTSVPASESPMSAAAMPTTAAT